MRLFQKPEAALQTDRVLAEELAAWKSLRRKDETPKKDGDIRDQLHAAKPAALCLSGGGIRSATFGLGVLQGLARKGLLADFDYVSTVSGGGYIGSWLTSWISRRAQASTPEGGTPDWNAASKEVFDKLAEGDEEHKFTRADACEEPEIAHLRSYSNYLTPKLGLLSVDTWTLAATYLRNVIVNWFVLVPFFLAILAVPRVWLALLARAGSLHVTEASALLGTAFVCGLLLVIYLSLIRPVPKVRTSDRWYGAPFAIFGPGMLVVQALAMCYIRGRHDPTTGSGEIWDRATWGIAEALPFGKQISAAFHHAGSAAPFPGAGLLFSLAFAVVILNVLGWAIYAVRLRRTSETPILRRVALELFGAIVAGASAGFFLWLLIEKLFDEPLQRVHELPLGLSDLGAEVFVAFAPALYLLAFFVQTMIFVGIAGKLNDDDDREWWARWAGWLLIVTVWGSAIAAIGIFGPLVIAKLPATMAALGGISGAITLALGRSGASPATPAQKTEKGWKAIAANASLALAAPLFAFIVCSALAYLNTWLLHTAFGVPGLSAAEAASLNVSHVLEPAAVAHFAVLRRTPFALVGLYSAGLLVFSVVASWFVQINRFSMHGLYRNRLTRAYLGASNRERHQNPFTGFDDNDNVFVEDLPRRPFHVVNVALNLVNDNNLAWQERKAAPFTISPLHSGSSLLGYRPSRDYTRTTDDAHGITLGTAMAISGAAVSPNMGYHTSPALSFLLTLFNVRLGWWLGNPRKSEYRKAAPYSSLMTILSEAFGRTKQDSRFVYLSDGGHFDNLGLYEMVRRRCHYIVVSDAGRDPGVAFEDLGNAIRKIRIDLGIPITIDDVQIYPREEKKPGRYYATGTINYNVVDENAEPGVLIYLKPSIYGKEPIDIRNYAAQNLEFPHESTSDQWFTESQFESYRALGAFVVEDMCRNRKIASLADFARDLPATETAHEPLVTDGLRKEKTPATERTIVPGSVEVPDAARNTLD